MILEITKTKEAINYLLNRVAESGKDLDILRDVLHELEGIYFKDGKWVWPRRDTGGSYTKSIIKRVEVLEKKVINIEQEHEYGEEIRRRNQELDEVII